MSRNPLSSNLRIPAHMDFDALASYAPSPLRPTAHGAINWIHNKIDPTQGLQEGPGSHNTSRPSTPPSPDSFTNPIMETMIVPVLRRRESSPDLTQLMDGSTYIFPMKVRLDPNDEERVAKELQEIIYEDYFKPIGRYVPNMDPGRQKGKRRSGTKELNKMMESVMIRPSLSAEGLERRKKLEQEWMAKPENDLNEKRRGFIRIDESEINGKLSDLSPFKPTIQAMSKQVTSLIQTNDREDPPEKVPKSNAEAGRSESGVKEEVEVDRTRGIERHEQGNATKISETVADERGTQNPMGQISTLTKPPRRRRFR
ncbi:hypothetical protein G7Y89_g3139 [Cudoniella acicularis]|uniref:Uncharacterized protein n=1 Tax=Cudoniella acicularis TaxID=354080 RepID=A0A8H4RRX9_9HELO|nr:hypothetical protein G7Y89_g3139 [Cudoniella acicularis]